MNFSGRIHTSFFSKLLFLSLTFTSVFSPGAEAELREGFCDPRRFTDGALLTKKDTVLVGYVKRTLLTTGMVVCSHRCLSHVWCISINYQYNASPVGKCELSDKGVLDPSDGRQNELVHKDNYIFSQLRSDKVRFFQL